MSTTERYEDYYQERLEEAWRFQDFVCEQLHAAGIVLQPIQSQAKQLLGENLFGMEVKLDRQWRKTGNLYIETHEKSHPGNREYVESGILRKDTSWMLGIGDFGRFFIFSTVHLCILNQRSPDWLRRTETPTSKGILLPVDRAELAACRIFDWDKETT